MDGYTVFKAAQRADAKRQPSARPSGDSGQKPSSSGGRGAKPGTHVGHTVLPTRREIICYDCGYTFTMAGRIDTTRCPKCKIDLDLTDHTIEGEWTAPLRTAGTIRIPSAAAVAAGDLVGHDIIVEGIIRGGTVKALRWLELRRGARIQQDAVEARDLRVGPGNAVALEGRARYHNVEIQGTLNADLRAGGLVVIRSGGLLRGRLQGARLAVEDGGGLLAEAEIRSGRREGQEEVS